MGGSLQARGGKVIALFFPILLFVLCHYEHCIANLYYLPAGAFAAAEYGVETTLTLAGCLKTHGGDVESCRRRGARSGLPLRLSQRMTRRP